MTESQLVDRLPANLEHGLTNVQKAALLDLDVRQLTHYLMVREAGQSHNWAMIFASRQAPSANRIDERWRKGIYQPGVSKTVHSRAEFNRELRRQNLEALDGPIGVKTRAYRTPAQLGAKNPEPPEFKITPELRWAVGKMAEHVTGEPAS